MPTALVDSSALIAVANSSDRHHTSAVAALQAQDDLATPTIILAETMSFVSARLGVAKQRVFWAAFMRSGIDLVDVDADLLGIAFDIDERYQDAEFGFADSILLAACERMKCARILTLDARLGLYRPTFASYLEVLP